MENLSTQAKRPILLKDNKTVLTCGLDWRQHKLEYNAWRRLWREHQTLMPDVWRDFDAFRADLPVRPHTHFFLSVLDQSAPLSGEALVWTE